LLILAAESDNQVQITPNLNYITMFHTMIIVAYIIPNIYVFLRIWQLFINKGYKLYFSLIYLLLVSIYPVSNFISEGDTGFIARILTITGNYILPFYLYLFLFILVFDIFLLINIPLKILSAGRRKSTGFKTAALSLIVLFSLGVVVAGIINFNTIRTSEYRIEIPGKSSKARHLKIAFIADFHLEEGTNIHFVERFGKKIADINPDLLVFGGDNVEGDREDENMRAFEKILSSIKTRYGVYTVLGNHEHYAGQDKGSFFDKAGIKVLSDTIVVIDSSFNLAGRNDSHFRERKSIDELLKLVNDSLPVILIDHRPTEIEQVSRTAADVQLSGHTHNGQLFPINLITKKVYELSWGYRKIGNTHFFVTSGIRLWGFPVRTAGKSEIMVIDITFTH
jgi:predicted MPP superfamily phosphohydrolase